MSKFLSLILRHEPERVGLKLDASGWVNVAELLRALKEQGFAVTREDLTHLVATNSKKRFAFSGDGSRIRASQGHSVEVDLECVPEIPPEFLYHGTATRFLPSIRKSGLMKMERHHVHLSRDPGPALEVGRRYGKAVLLTIRATQMDESGHLFYRSANGVWLVDSVPTQFIDWPPGDSEA